MLGVRLPDGVQQERDRLDKGNGEDCGWAVHVRSMGIIWMKITSEPATFSPQLGDKATFFGNCPECDSQDAVGESIDGIFSLPLAQGNRTGSVGH